MPSEFVTKAIDNGNCLTNLSNSVLKGMGADPIHEDIPIVTEAIKGHKKVCAVLLDGMGTALLRKCAAGRRAYKKNKLTEIQSVNPATTVAATTAFLTGRYPMETGWLGWSVLLPEYGGAIDVFPNVYTATQKPLPRENAMQNACSIRNLESLLGEAGIRARIAYEEPIGQNTYSGLKDMPKVCKKFFDAGDGFLYLYHPKIDSLAHHHGVDSRKVKKEIAKSLLTVKKMAKQNPDVLFLVFADHGLIDVTYRDIAAFKDLHELLGGPLCLEGRTRAIYVKEGCKDRFAELFSQYFGEDFELVDSVELLESGYFGKGTESLRTRGFLGDFVAIAKGDCFLADSTAAEEGIVPLKGHHAGILPDEKNIAVLAYNLRLS